MPVQTVTTDRTERRDVSPEALRSSAGPAREAMSTLMSWEDVPLFDSEQSEADYWGATRIDVRLMESAVAAAAEDLESVTMTLRIDPRMLARIKRLARSRYLNYQSMIKQWLSERMEQEMRER